MPTPIAPTATPIPTKEPTPATLQNVTLRDLYEESVANLARYDHLYKGKSFLVEGAVDFMSNYQVVVDAGFGDPGYYGNVRAILTDLPHSDQVPLNSGDVIAAICQIGRVEGYGIYMENCSLELEPLTRVEESTSMPTPTGAIMPTATAS